LRVSRFGDLDARVLELQRLGMRMTPLGRALGLSVKPNGTCTTLANALRRARAAEEEAHAQGAPPPTLRFGDEENGGGGLVAAALWSDAMHCAVVSCPSGGMLLTAEQAEELCKFLEAAARA
jgi:hypothetical protein